MYIVHDAPKPGAKFGQGDVRSTHDEQRTQDRLKEVEKFMKDPAGWLKAHGGVSVAAE